MNIIIISGRMARDCEPIYTDKGLCISKFAVAVQRPTVRRRSEETPPPKEICDFIPCVAFGKQAEMIANTLHKGNRILVHGRLHVSSYTNKENKKVYAQEVVVSSFEYVEPKDSSGEVDGSGNFSDFGIEDLEF